MAKRVTKSSGATADKGAKAPSPTYGPDVSVALFKGDDAFLRSAYTDKLRAAIEAVGTPVDVIRFDGATAPAADVLDECRSFGLMAQHKLVIVDQADEFLKESDDEEEEQASPALKRGPARPRKRDLIEAYIQSPTPGATLVLRAQGWRPGRIDKMIPAVGVIEDCEAPDARKAAGALVRRAREAHGVTLEADAAELLVERLGRYLGPLVQEVSKLATMAGPGGTITVAHVREMVGLTREEEAWGFQDWLLAGDIPAAMEKLRELLEVSRVDEVPLRFTMIDAVKKVHAFARAAEKGVPPQALAKEMRIWPPDRAAVFARAASKAGPRAAADLVVRAVAKDYAGKTGGGDPTLGVETLALDIMLTLAGGDAAARKASR